ncbi:hypothetical protein TVAG_286340 [Trichomonas vaginalis G3]|uniref:Uncharacterized protein n=1 Tax=Trichomonas vaginalis (strain ATCC PRA-98 / G3) TaxID=412133 RepID=A2EPE8_TRIV3|nr:Ras GTPase-related family [Trichomonas vaginalis G3]EAY05456.1 hypothetical protein TVAG_286340 [Trichomonas vaginalis G3]KAI5503566.1 Ras GTPase-related family [Trichomonas vaginalis G3]|eukprot:XP_001317679.1 hypothetical protein [Trichomonas vaginalis G3]
MGIEGSTAAPQSPAARPKQRQQVAHQILIVIRGARKTGKTNLLARMKGLQFIDQYKPTPIMQATELIWTPISSPNDKIKIVVWDVVDHALKLPNVPEGKELPDATTVDTFSRADGVVIIYDPRDEESARYALSVVNEAPEHLPKILVANFLDQFQEPPKIHPILEGVKDKIFHLNASMKSNAGLSEIAKWLDLPLHISLKKLYENLIVSANQELDSIKEELHIKEQEIENTPIQTQPETQNISDIKIGEITEGNDDKTKGDSMFWDNNDDEFKNIKMPANLPNLDFSTLEDTSNPLDNQQEEEIEKPKPQSRPPKKGSLRRILDKNKSAREKPKIIQRTQQKPIATVPVAQPEEKQEEEDEESNNENIKQIQPPKPSQPQIQKQPEPVVIPTIAEPADSFFDNEKAEEKEDDKGEFWGDDDDTPVVPPMKNIPKLDIKSDEITQIKPLNQIETAATKPEVEEKSMESVENQNEKIISSPKQNSSSKDNFFDEDNAEDEAAPAVPLLKNLPKLDIDDDQTEQKEKTQISRPPSRLQKLKEKTEKVSLKDRLKSKREGTAATKVEKPKLRGPAPVAPKKPAPPMPKPQQKLDSYDSIQNNAQSYDLFDSPVEKPNNSTQKPQQMIEEYDSFDSPKELTKIIENKPPQRIEDYDAFDTPQISSKAEKIKNYSENSVQSQNLSDDSQYNSSIPVEQPITSATSLSQNNLTEKEKPKPEPIEKVEEPKKEDVKTDDKPEIITKLPDEATKPETNTKNTEFDFDNAFKDIGSAQIQKEEEFNFGNAFKEVEEERKEEVKPQQQDKTQVLPENNQTISENKINDEFNFEEALKVIEKAEEKQNIDINTNIMANEPQNDDFDFNISFDKPEKKEETLNLGTDMFKPVESHEIPVQNEEDTADFWDEQLKVPPQPLESPAKSMPIDDNLMTDNFMPKESDFFTTDDINQESNKFFDEPSQEDDKKTQIIDGNKKETNSLVEEKIDNKFFDEDEKGTSFDDNKFFDDENKVNEEKENNNFFDDDESKEETKETNAFWGDDDENVPSIKPLAKLPTLDTSSLENPKTTKPTVLKKRNEPKTIKAANKTATKPKILPKETLPKPVLTEKPKILPKSAVTPKPAVIVKPPPPPPKPIVIENEEEEYNYDEDEDDFYK